GDADLGQLDTEILLQDPTHRQKPKKRADMRDDSRNGLWLQVLPPRHKLRQIQRLNFVQRARFARVEEIQEDREFCRTPIHRRWSKMEAILTVHFVITKCISHFGNQMDCLNLR